MVPKDAVVPRRESGYVKRMMYAILALAAFVAFVVLLVYIYHGIILIRTLVNEPTSQIAFFGQPIDPYSLARRLNSDGTLISMADVITATNDSCGVAVAATGAPTLPRGQMTAVTFHVDGVERHGVVYVPNSYPESVANSTQAVAMLVLFHGLNDDCEHFLSATGFLPYAEKYSLVLISACGSQGYLGTGWNAGMCCGFSGDKPDDVSFAQQIVQDMRRALCVNERKVMAVGFSNGAMLAEVLACEAPDVFQAVVSVGGVVELRPGNAEGLKQCTEKVGAKPLQRASVLMVHGTSDVMVPWAGNKLLGFPSVDANVNGWVTRNGCNADKVNRTIHTQTYSNTIYTDCSSQALGEEPIEPFHPITSHVQRQQNHLESVARAVMVLGHKKHKRGHTEAAAKEEMGVAEVLHFSGERADKVHKKHSHDHSDDAPAEAEEIRYRKGGEEGTVKGRRGRHPHPKHGFRSLEHPPHDPEHVLHHRESEHGRRPDPCLLQPVDGLQATLYEGSDVSQVELVKVEGGAHRWPNDEEFSTTNYVIQFGARVFGGYDA